MKKLIPVLLLFACSLFCLNNAQAEKAIVKNMVPSEEATVIAQPVFGGHWVAMCVYNPKTDTYDFILVWVEDEES